MPVFDHIEIGKRISEIEKDLSLNNKAFATAIGANEAFWSKVKKGQKALSERYMEVLRDKYHVNLSWLLFGDGEKYRPSGKEKSGAVKQPDYNLLTQMKKQFDELRVNFDKLVEPLQEHSSKKKKQMKEFENIVEDKPLITGKR